VKLKFVALDFSGVSDADGVVLKFHQLDQRDFVQQFSTLTGDSFGQARHLC
jgi:hypothetical protein